MLCAGIAELQEQHPGDPSTALLHTQVRMPGTQALRHGWGRCLSATSMQPWLLVRCAHESACPVRSSSVPVLAIGPPTENL